MAIDFPDAPLDGQKFTYNDQQGRIVTYTYNSPDDSWTGPIATVVSVASPTADQITANPPFVSGTGTKEDPFVLKPATIPSAGLSAFCPQKITITGQKNLDRVVVLNRTLHSESRFQQPVGIVDSNGEYKFNLSYRDFPKSNINGIKFAAKFEIGSAHISWLVTQLAPHVIPAPTPTVPAPARERLIHTLPADYVAPTPAAEPEPLTFVPFDNVFTVRVQLKTGENHTYGIGSLKAYYLNELEAYTLVFNKGTTYRFNQSHPSNDGHPIRFYLDEAKATEYISGVQTNGTPGQVGAFSQITVPSDAPSVLYYQCSNHGYMGGKITVAD